jgi:hypothetical protein
MGGGCHLLTSSNDGTVVLWSGEEELVTEETWESVWHWARDVWLES